MSDIYRIVRRASDKCMVISAWLYVRLQKMLQMKVISRLKKQMWNTELDAIPIVSDSDVQSSVQGCYCVGKGIKYRCKSGKVKLITLDLSAFRQMERVIGPGEDIRIPPYTAHVFLTESGNSESCEITRGSRKPCNYSFMIDMECEYTGVSDEDFRLDKRRMRIAESGLKLTIARNADQGLTYSKYIRTLATVRRIARSMDLSSFEHALLLGMAFDWLQRLGQGKERPAHIAFGSYQRLYSSSDNGYHDIRATNIDRNAGLLIHAAHRTHFAGDGETPLPRINIARNVMIGDLASIEVGTGLSIGEFSWIAPNVDILKHEHRPNGGGQINRSVDYTTFYPTEIGSYAMIGQRSVILPKAFYIGKGAVVGHSAIVTRSVGDYVIAAGNPARALRYNLELAERLEEHTKVDRPYEAPIPYENLLQKVSSYRHVVILNAQNPETIVSAASLFEHVLAVNCCVGNVLPLIKRLEQDNLNNVCLQSGGMSFIHELNYRKPFTLIWLSESEASDQMAIILEGSCDAILAIKGGKCFDFLSTLAFMRPDSQLESNDYVVFNRAEDHKPIGSIHKPAYRTMY